MQISQLFSLTSTIILLVLVLDLLRRRKLKEKYAIWSLVAAFLVIVLSVFPAIVTNIAEQLNIENPSNFGFFVAIVVLFLVTIQIGVELTRAEEKIQILAEEIALLKEQIQPK